MTSRALPFVVFVIALGLTLVASRSTAPAFDELARLRAVERSLPVVRGVASDGPRALANTEARAAYATFDGRGTLPVLVGAWSKLSLGRLGIVDPLTAARLPWLVLAALGVTALFALVRARWGVPTAALAAGLLALLPRWLHGAAVTSEGVTVVSTWLCVALAYQKSIAPGRRRLCWMVSAAALVGIGAAISVASLWVLAIVALHYVLSRWRFARRLLRTGRVPVPAFLLLSLPLAPLCLLLANPALWQTNGAALVRWALAPLAPHVEPAPYAGEVVRALPVPGGFASSWLVLSLPLALTLAALLGGFVVAHAGLGRRFASGSLRPPRDRLAVGVLFALGLGAALVGPPLSPDVFTRFPPRVEIALPFVAAFAAVGLSRIALAQGRATVGYAIAGVLLLSLAVVSLHAPATLAASFEPLFGGSARIARTRALPLGDGSELGPIAAGIDQFGMAQIALHAPDVPAEAWDVLRSAGRMRTFVVTVPAPTGTEYELVRGTSSGQALVTVQRGGATLWTLAR